MVDWAPFVTQTQVDQYCVQAAGGPIKITLVWADPPADVTAALSLVNDLDLTVHADSLSGYSLRGNGAPSGDHLNNVEQVRVLFGIVDGCLVMHGRGGVVAQHYCLEHGWCLTSK